MTRTLAIAAAAAAVLVLAPGAGAQGEDVWASEESVAAFDASLDRQHGRVTLLHGDVALDIPKSLYFLDAADSQRVLIDAWGNPTADGVLGMIFAEGSSPVEQGGWGLVISFDPSGYVSDEDASTIDYDEMMADMQADTRQDSKARERQGFASVELIGWAAPPRYNAEEHKLYWAQELHFGEEELNTLNYNIRVLGREGVLVMNFVAGIDALGEIEAAAPAVLDVAQFTEGNRYEDFNPSTDRVAGYGLAGLIAGGAGAVVLKKTGLLAVLLIFLKKGWIVIVAALGAIGSLVRRLFGGQRNA